VQWQKNVKKYHWKTGWDGWRYHCRQRYRSLVSQYTGRNAEILVKKWNRFSLTLWWKVTFKPWCFSTQKRKKLVNGNAPQGQWCPALPIWNLCPPFTFDPWLLHTSHTVFLKCGPPFWFLAPPGFWPPLLLYPGDGPGSHHYNCLLFIIIHPVTNVHVMLKKIECERQIWSTKRSKGKTERHLYLSIT